LLRLPLLVVLTIFLSAVGLCFRDVKFLVEIMIQELREKLR
jgi:hypothetical protein